MLQARQARRSLAAAPAGRGGGSIGGTSGSCLAIVRVCTASMRIGRFGPEPEPEPGPELQSAGPIEERAVTLAWLARLFAAETSAELEAAATADAVAYLSGRLPPEACIDAGLDQLLDSLVVPQAESQSEAAHAAAVFHFATLAAVARGTDKEEAAEEELLVDFDSHARVLELLGQPRLTPRAWEQVCARQQHHSTPGVSGAIGASGAIAAAYREPGSHTQWTLTLPQFVAARMALPHPKPAAAVCRHLRQALLAEQPYGARDLTRRKRGAFLSGRDFHRHVVKAKTHAQMCRFVELPGVQDEIDPDGRRSVGAADAFVSWTWDTPWQVVLATLEPHTAGALAAGKPAPRYWVDIFAINQHTALPPWKCESGLGAACPGCAAVGEDMMSMAEMEAGRTDKGFERVVNSAGCVETIVVLESWEAPRPLGRVWCLYESLLTIMAANSDGSRGKQLTMGLAPEERVSLLSGLEADFRQVQMRIGAVDTAAAEATMPADRDLIFGAVQRLLPRGFLDLNNKMKARLRDWTCDTAAAALAAMPPAQRTTSPLVLAVGRYHHAQGRYVEADALLTEAVAGRTDQLGDAAAETLEAMGRLAWVRVEMRQHSEAESLMRTVLEKRRAVLGTEHPATLEALSDIGVLYRRMGKHDAALPMLQAALAARRKLLGDDHPDTLQSMQYLGTLYEMMDQPDQAEPLQLAKLAASRVVLGNDHPETIETIQNLGALYYRLRAFDKATPLMEEGLAAYRRLLGDTHSDTLVSIGNVALLAKKTAQYERAEVLMREVLAAARQAAAATGANQPVGEEQVPTLEAIGNLAGLMESMDRCQEAETLRLEAVDGWQALRGSDDLATLMATSHLGLLYSTMLWEYAKALELQRVVLAGRRKLLGADNLATVHATYNLGNTLENLGRPTEAAALYEAEVVGWVAIGDREEALYAAERLAGLLTDNKLSTDALTVLCAEHGLVIDPCFFDR